MSALGNHSTEREITRTTHITQNSNLIRLNLRVVLNILFLIFHDRPVEVARGLELRRRRGTQYGLALTCGLPWQHPCRRDYHGTPMMRSMVGVAELGRPFPQAPPGISVLHEKVTALAIIIHLLEVRRRFFGDLDRCGQAAEGLHSQRRRHAPDTRRPLSRPLGSAA